MLIMPKVLYNKRNIAAKGSAVVELVSSPSAGKGRYRIDHLSSSPTLRSYVFAQLENTRGVTLVRGNGKSNTLAVEFESPHTSFSIAETLDHIVRNYRIPEPAGVLPSDADNRSRSLGTEIKAHAREVSELKEQIERQWYLQSEKEVLESFNTDAETGLGDLEARELLLQYGPNAFEEAESRSDLSIFLEQFQSPPVAMLGIASVISVATGGVADALVILAVVGINAGIGYATESQSERTIHALKNMVKPTAEVVRDGVPRVMEGSSVVPGDLIVVRPGSFIPADARLVESSHLSVDESALTGESLPIKKSSRTIDAEPTVTIPLAERFNMLYMGTTVTGGEARAVVVATGRYTEIGKIQSLVGSTVSPQTPLQTQLGEIGKQLAWLSSGICAAVFGIGILRGYGLLEMLKSSISLAVAAVPEGLPTVATTILALGIREMKKHRVLIRHLDAVETLGTAKVICLDKTGTLTKNRMSVVRLELDGRRINVGDTRFDADGETFDPQSNDAFSRLIQTAVLCNESVLVRSGHSLIAEGSATENALLHLAMNAGLDVGTLRETLPAYRTVHRSERRKYMVTYHRLNAKEHLAALKGSPAEVAALCDRILENGTAVPLSDAAREKLLERNNEMAADALRVLAFAYAIFPSDEHKPESYIWLGLSGLADPLRDGVGNVIRDFHKAGIDTIMITGDQSATAYAIGKELGISGGAPIEILDSSHLENIDHEALKGIARRVNIFSRVSPTNKLQIVQSLQDAGRVVAMTGDGINDSPALKAADIGVAMGKSGTDVAREVADVILEDDNLETMIVAVKQGRSIYSNIRKSIHYLLSTNISEIAVMFLSLAAGTGQPLNTMQLLWINLMTDVAPSLALALEPPEPDILDRPPRDPSEPIIKRSDFKRIGFESTLITTATMASYGYGLARFGPGPAASGMAFQTLTTAQILHALSCRSTHYRFLDPNLPENRTLSIAVAGSLGLQVLAIALPPLRQFLGIAPAGAGGMLVSFGNAALPLLINELKKAKIPKELKP